ncbi:MAG: hypothetical protein NTZ60_03560 [Campylobacterales bacterium]|nr:hypothetical protein [Campylobacterales bacterium]
MLLQVLFERGEKWLFYGVLVLFLLPHAKIGWLLHFLIFNWHVDFYEAVILYAFHLGRG